MHNNPLKGIILMMLSVFGVATMSMLAKYISPTHSAIDAVFYRNLFGLIIVSVVILAIRKPHYFKTKRLKAQIWRGAVGTIGVGLMFYAFALMPMAETTALMFVGGLVTPIMATIFLGEHVGPYRWAAIIVGCLGAIIIVMPDGTQINMWGVTIALISSIIGGSIISILLRSLGQTDHALTTVFYFMLVGLLMLIPFMIIWGSLPTKDTLIFVLALGFCGVITQFLKTEALKWGEVSLLMPLFYTNLIWATAYGWFIWNDWPTLNVFIGGGVIIGSNIVIIWREKIKKDRIIHG
jgi:drug/metabolite transporter (DMT)-like permease